jgi:DNA/RNA-binding domain of Phe-tRNA-synthetase-like protein
MPDPSHLLESASVDRAIFALRPDYRALLLTATGLASGPSDESSDRLLAEAEASVVGYDPEAVERMPHIAAWREAYRSFGAKPQRTRSSVEALIRRAIAGELPRVDRLTDTYNAISVIYQLPLGGEDLRACVGAPRLVVATGDEPFDTSVSGEPAVEHPEPGEVVWADDAGVTCRRWNWRQGTRTRLTESTVDALFIFDALDPVSDIDLIAAADRLEEHLTRPGRSPRFARRLISAKENE